MTQAVTTTKTGFDATGDPVASATMLTYANSVETLFNNVLNGAQAFDRQLFQAAATYQIVAGAIAAPTQALVTLTPESGVTDTLDTIGVTNNRFIVLKAAAGTTVILSSGVGNVNTFDNTSIVLTGNNMAMAWCQGSQWSVVGSGGGVTNNLAASTDPASGEDTADGYSVGSLWGNTTRDQVYVNVDPTLGVAIWKRVTPPKNRWRTRAAAAALASDGIAAPTLTTNTAANVNDANNTLLEMQTTASSGNIAGIVSATFNLIRASFDPVFEVYVKTFSDITTLRLWIGLVSADVTNVDTLAAGTKFIGFRFSTVAADGGWAPVLNDGTNQATGTPIGTVAINTVYKLQVRVVSGTPIAYFSVNDGAEQSLATNFPAIATDLGFVVRCITQSAANRRLDFASAGAWW